MGLNSEVVSRRRQLRAGGALGLQHRPRLPNRRGNDRELGVEFFANSTPQLFCLQIEGRICGEEETLLRHRASVGRSPSTGASVLEIVLASAAKERRYLSA